MLQAPSLGAHIGRAAVHGDAFGPVAGLNLLDALPPSSVASHQPFWAVRAHLLQQAGDAVGARQARQLAIELADDPAIRRHLAGFAAPPPDTA